MDCRLPAAVSRPPQHHGAVDEARAALVSAGGQIRGRAGVCTGLGPPLCRLHVAGAWPADRRVEHELLVVRTAARSAFRDLLQLLAAARSLHAEHRRLCLWLDPVLVRVLGDELWSPRGRARSEARPRVGRFRQAAVACRRRLLDSPQAGRPQLPLVRRARCPGLLSAAIRSHGPPRGRLLLARSLGRNQPGVCRLCPCGFRPAVRPRRLLIQSAATTVSLRAATALLITATRPRATARLRTSRYPSVRKTSNSAASSVAAKNIQPIHQ